jgi:hypothetical protein
MINNPNWAETVNHLLFEEKAEKSQEMTVQDQDSIRLKVVRLKTEWFLTR